jgi:hypothetical protein
MDLAQASEYYHGGMVFHNDGAGIFTLVDAGDFDGALAAGADVDAGVVDHGQGVKSTLPARSGASTPLRSSISSIYPASH